MFAHVASRNGLFTSYKVKDFGIVNKAMNHADIVQIDDICVRGNTWWTLTFFLMDFDIEDCATCKSNPHACFESSSL